MTVRPVQTELQLSAMAAAADRANRPTWLIALGGGLIALTLLFAVFSLRAFRNDRLLLRSGVASAVQVNETIVAIETEKAKEPNLDVLYPVQPNVSSDIDQKAAAAGFSNPPTVSEKRSKPVTGSPRVTSSFVECRVNNEPLEKIFKFVDEVQSSQMLPGVFLAKLELTPVTPEWNASLQFRLYEKAEKSR